MYDRDPRRRPSVELHRDAARLGGAVLRPRARDRPARVADPWAVPGRRHTGDGVRVPRARAEVRVAHRRAEREGPGPGIS